MVIPVTIMERVIPVLIAMLTIIFKTITFMLTVTIKNIKHLQNTNSMTAPQIIPVSFLTSPKATRQLSIL